MPNESPGGGEAKSSGNRHLFQEVPHENSEQKQYLQYLDGGVIAHILWLKMPPGHFGGR